MQPASVNAFGVAASKSNRNVCYVRKHYCNITNNSPISRVPTKNIIFMHKWKHFNIHFPATQPLLLFRCRFTEQRLSFEQFVLKLVCDDVPSMVQNRLSELDNLQ
jgi:hypothetical protein